MASAEQTQQDLHDQSIPALLKQLATETTTLVRQELDLAKAEMSEKGRKAGPGFGLIGAAGGMALLAAGALTTFLILALDGVADRFARVANPAPTSLVIDDRRVQLVLGREVAKDDGLGDASRLRDLLGRRAAKAALRKETHGDAHDLHLPRFARHARRRDRVRLAAA